MDKKQLMEQIKELDKRLTWQLQEITQRQIKIVKELQEIHNTIAGKEKDYER